MELRRLFGLLLLFFLTFSMFRVSSASAKTLYIGDSRTVGMAQANSVSGGDCHGGKWDTSHCNILNNSDSNGDKWFCQIGAGLNLLKDNSSTIKDLAADCDNIVISLGVNDLYNNKKYIDEINKFTEEMKKLGKTVSVTTVNPVSDDKYADNPNLNNQKIDEFNNKLKNGLSSDINFIDTNSCIKGSATYTDGLHYKAETNKKVQQCIKNGLKETNNGQQNTGTEGGGTGSGEGGQGGSGDGGQTSPAAEQQPQGSQCMTENGTQTCIPNNIPTEEYIKDSDCKTTTGYQSDFTNKCLTCDLFATILRAAQDIAKGSFGQIAEDLIKLLVVAFLIFIAYTTLITIASPEAQKISKYLTTLLSQGFKVALTVLILKNPAFLYDKALAPILEGGVDFAMSLCENCSAAQAKGAKYAGHFDQSNKFLDAKTMQDLAGAADMFSEQAALVPAVGRVLVCRAWDRLPWYHFKIVPRVSMFVEGCIIYIFGLMIWLAIGFYLLDCAVSLGFVCALMSFFVACWPFKQTSNYTKVGWNMFLNVFFNFVMMSVVVTAIVEISMQSLSVGLPLDDFLMFVNGDNVKMLDKLMDVAGLQMVMIVACAMICLKLPKEAGRLANKFAGGAQISLGGQLGGMIAATTTNAAIGKEALRPGKDGKRHLGGIAGKGWQAAKATAGSIGEHTGAKGALNAAGKSIKNKANAALGKIGLGSKANMGAKGRDSGANENRGTENQFKQDR